MNKNLVSIVMNCHNGEKYLKDAINSIIKQSYNKWELIFFDNKSNDNSEKIVSSYNDKLAIYKKLEKLPRNSSPNRHRNRCWATGRSRAYYRDFGLSRHVLREMAHEGLIPGLTILIAFIIICYFFLEINELIILSMLAGNTAVLKAKFSFLTPMP